MINTALFIGFAVVSLVTNIVLLTLLVLTFLSKKKDEEVQTKTRYKEMVIINGDEALITWNEDTLTAKSAHSVVVDGDVFEAFVSFANPYKDMSGEF